MKTKRALSLFCFNFPIVTFILLRICDDIFLVHDAVYEGVSEKVQTSANTQNQASTFQYIVAVCPPHRAPPAPTGPCSPLLGYDIIISRQWMSAVLLTPPTVQQQHSLQAKRSSGRPASREGHISGFTCFSSSKSLIIYRTWSRSNIVWSVWAEPSVHSENRLWLKCPFCTFHFKTPMMHSDNLCS